jgi:Common central domain of tyrosinase.
MALRVRKNQADLSDDEKSRFIAAIKKIKSTGEYDHFIVIHQASMAMPVGHPENMNMWAHQRPGFLPWHRQLILDFENALRAADSSLHGGAPSNLTLPYWDWVHYRTKKRFLWWGKIWHDDMMGPNGDDGKNNAVTSGAFRAPAPNSDGDWNLFYTPDQNGMAPPLQMDPNSGPSFLQRTFGKDVASDELPTQDEWDAAKVITVYDEAPWDNTVGAATTKSGFVGVNSFRNVLEGWVPYNPAAREAELHNKVHVWVGGSMEPISSPNDPVFFLHHCNIDRLWAYWQLRNPKSPYLPDGSTPALTGPEGHNLNDAMHPWDGIARSFTLPGGGTYNMNLPVIKIADVLNHNALGYRYDSDPPALSPHP